MVVRLAPPLLFLAIAAAGPAGPCGPDALGYACERLGVPYDPECLREQVPDAGGNTTLLDLKRAAEALGLVAQGVRMTAEEAVAAPKPFIAHVDGDHFVTVTGADRLYMYVYDPAGDDTPWRHSDFARRFTGAALLLSLPEPAAAGLRVEPEEADFGLVPRGFRVKRRFILRNAGEERVRIWGVSCSNPAATVLLERGVLEPGESTPIHVTLDTSGERGRVGVAFRVRSDDPAGSVFFRLVGVVKVEFDFSPKRLSLGPLDPGQEGEARVVFVGVEGGGFGVEEPTGEGSAWLSPAVEPTGEEGSWVLRVRYKAPGQPGAYSGEVLVHTGAEGTPQVRIPVTCTVRSRVEVHPSALFFGPGAGEMHLSIATRGGVAVTGVSTTGGGFEAELLPLGGSRWTVRVRFTPGSQHGTVASQLLIGTDSPGEPLLRVPLFARVP